MITFGGIALSFWFSRAFATALIPSLCGIFVYRLVLLWKVVLIRSNKCVLRVMIGFWQPLSVRIVICIGFNNVTEMCFKHNIVVEPLIVFFKIERIGFTRIRNKIKIFVQEFKFVRRETFLRKID